LELAAYLVRGEKGFSHYRFYILGVRVVGYLEMRASEKTKPTDPQRGLSLLPGAEVRELYGC